MIYHQEKQISGTQSAQPPQQKLRRQGNVRSFYKRTPENRFYDAFFDNLSQKRSFGTAFLSIAFRLRAS
jgi:hypothetical protein